MKRNILTVLSSTPQHDITLESKLFLLHHGNEKRATNGDHLQRHHTQIKY